MSMQRAFPARGSSIPTVLARIGNLELLARTVVDGFINGLHRAPYFGASIDFAEHRGYVAGRRHPPRRLAAVRADRSLLRQAVRGRHQHQLLGAARRLEVDGLRQPRRSRSSNTAVCSAACLPTSRTGSATASASSRSTTTSSTHVPPSAKHFDVVLHTLDRARSRERPGNLTAPLHKMAEHFERRGMLVLISDFYEEPDAMLEAIKPLRFRGNDLIVFHVLDPAELDFGYDDASSFEDLESGEQIPVVPESLARAVPRADPGAHRRADDEVLRASHRLHAAQHVAAARPRAVQLPVDARAADAGCDDDVFSDPALPRRPRRARRSGADPPDPARAEAASSQFPSLMFLRRIPYQSVRRRRIRHWLLLLMRLAALALIVAGVRAAVLPAHGRGGRGGERRARGRRPARSARTAWATAIAGEGARRRRSDAINGLEPSDRGIARAVLVERRSRAALDLRSQPAAGGRRRRAAGRRRDALRSGAEAGRQHPQRVGAAAARSDPDQRFPAERLAGRGRRAAAGRRDADAGAGRRRGHREPVGDAGRRLQRSTFSNQERVTVTAGVVNHGTRAGDETSTLTLELDGRGVQTQRVNVEPGGSASVTFAPFTRRRAQHARVGAAAEGRARARQRRSTSSSSPDEPVRVILVERSGAPRDGSLYLARALAIGESPRFEVTSRERRRALGRRSRSARRSSCSTTSPVASSHRRSPGALRRTAAAGCSSLPASARAWPGQRRRCCRAFPGMPSIGRSGTPARLGGARVRPSGVRGVPRAAQRRLRGRAVLRLSRRRRPARARRCSRASTTARRRCSSGRAATAAC